MSTEPENSSANSVYENLKTWMVTPAQSRIHVMEKTRAANNEARQLIFCRERKALAKYGTGLKLAHALPFVSKTAEKLGDAMFFLYSALHNGIYDNEKEVVLVQNLLCLLSNLLRDYRKKFPAKY